jgi:glycine/D-amino acid oxidase-like deaminating enzyme
VAAELTRALADSEQRVFWLDSADAPDPLPPLDGEVTCDLAIVGGGFTGLWAALMAAPDEDVVLLEGDRCGWGASGRNGGFLEASLTHGLDNGLSRWPDEMPTLERLGGENFEAIRATLAERGIDAAWNGAGVIDVATREHEVPWLVEAAEAAREHGEEVTLLDRAAVRAEVNSPTYLGGLWHRTGNALVDPARLAWGLREAALADGIRIHEHTRVTRLRRDGDGVLLETAAAGTGKSAAGAGKSAAGAGRVRARRVLLATNAYKPLVRSIRRYVVPVYDYVLVTEPLSDAQRAALGWEREQGVSDSGNRFHYYRLTPGVREGELTPGVREGELTPGVREGELTPGSGAGQRILWGGYEALYHFRNGMRPELEDHAPTFELLARNFAATFPQLEGIRFTHRWAGAIDTSSRFCVTFGRALGGRVAYAVGYTGLGVAASRFGARVALDLLHERDTEATRLQLVRSRPIPFPPEPLRYAVIQATRRALARADERGGKRGLWLRGLDRIGAGFDS